MSIPITPEEIAVVGDQFQKRPLVAMVLCCLVVIGFLSYVIIAQEKRLDASNERAQAKEEKNQQLIRDQYQQNLIISIKLADAERSMRESQEAQSKKK